MADDVVALLKLAAVEAVEAEKPAAVLIGKVISAPPVVVEVEQRLRLSGDRLAVVAGLDLETNDTVLLLREQGGQRFFAVGKL